MKHRADSQDSATPTAHNNQADKRSPMSGIHIELTVHAPYGWRSQFTVTPLDETKEVFDFTVDRFRQRLWRDLMWLKNQGKESR